MMPDFGCMILADMNLRDNNETSLFTTSMIGIIFGNLKIGIENHFPSLLISIDDSG